MGEKVASAFEEKNLFPRAALTAETEEVGRRLGDVDVDGIELLDGRQRQRLHRGHQGPDGDRRSPDAAADGRLERRVGEVDARSVEGGLVRSHAFWRPDQTNQCTACHGSRVGDDYTGAAVEGNQQDVHSAMGRNCRRKGGRPELIPQGLPGQGTLGKGRPP